LITDYELDIPVENPYGVTWGEGYFWITDVKSGEIFGIHPELDNLHRIEAPRKNITGITFEGEYMWVLVDAWDTITYPHHSLPKTQAFKLDPWNGNVLDSVMIPYYNVPEVSERFMYGLAYFDSSLFASFNGGRGPSLIRIDENGFTNICCAHPTGMEVIDGELWSILDQGDIMTIRGVDYVIGDDGDSVMVDESGIIVEGDSSDVDVSDPVIPGFRAVNVVIPVVLDDSGSYEDWSRAMEFDFYATDIAWDGSNIWLLDPVEKKLKMMVRDSLMPPPPEPPDQPFWIEYLEVVPERPDINDEIMIVSHTGFSSGGCNLTESDIYYDADGALRISASHEIGMLTYICGSTDTFNLGKLSQGYHEVYYELSASNMRVQSITELVQIYVQDTVSYPSYFELIPEVPVAGQEVKIVVHGICYINTWFDLVERHISLHAFFGSCIMAPCGIDTLSLGILGEDSYTLDYYLYDVCMSGQDMDSLVYYENIKFDVANRATSISETTGQDITIYPNPASDLLFIRVPQQSRDSELSLISVNGKLILNEIIEAGSELHRVDLSEVKAGYYILRISDQDQVHTSKISVIK